MRSAFIASKGRRDDDALWVSNRGTLAANGGLEALRRHLKAAGLPQVTMHSLRHGWSARLVQSGMPDRASLMNLGGLVKPDHADHALRPIRGRGPCHRGHAGAARQVTINRIATAVHEPCCSACFAVATFFSATQAEPLAPLVGRRSGPPGWAVRRRQGRLFGGGAWHDEGVTISELGLARDIASEP